MSIALEWGQSIEYVHELPDMDPIWDALEIFNYDPDYVDEEELKEDRDAKIKAFRQARSKQVSKKEVLTS
jgi:hypothetical protein